MIWGDGWESSDLLTGRENAMTQTPLTDFLSTLADPTTLDAFRDDPAATATAAGLPADLIDLVLSGHAGAIRFRAVQELERAGMAPSISDRVQRK
jgi:hypothetical protein